MFFSEIIDIGLASYGSPVPRSTSFLSLFSLCVVYRKCRDLKGTGWPVLTNAYIPCFLFMGCFPEPRLRGRIPVAGNLATPPSVISYIPVDLHDALFKVAGRPPDGVTFQTQQQGWLEGCCSAPGQCQPRTESSCWWSSGCLLEAPGGSRGSPSDRAFVVGPLWPE